MAASDAVCKPCSGNTYALVGFSACFLCSPGTYFNGNRSASCPSCSAGWYATGSGFSECLSCSEGSYSASTSQNCTLCAAGFFSNLTAQTACIECAPGDHTHVTGHTACTNCPTCDINATYLGGICWSQGHNTSCSCNAGFYGAGFQCTACPYGQYAPSNASLTCLNCTQCSPFATTLSPCISASKANTAVCSCNLGYYGSGLACSPCPPHTQTLSLNTTTLLGCRCLGGFVCSYTKRISATLRIPNMSLANFTANFQNNFMQAIAKAAGVLVNNIKLTATVAGRRLLAFEPPPTTPSVAWGQNAPQELTVKFHIHGSDYLHPAHAALGPLRKTTSFEIEWEHAHDVHVRMQR